MSRRAAPTRARIPAKRTCLPSAPCIWMGRTSPVGPPRPQLLPRSSRTLASDELPARSHSGAWCATSQLLLRVYRSSSSCTGWWPVRMCFAVSYRASVVVLACTACDSPRFHYICTDHASRWPLSTAADPCTALRSPHRRSQQRVISSHQVRRQVRRQVHPQVHPQVRRQVRREVRRQVRPRPRSHHHQQLRLRLRLPPQEDMLMVNGTTTLETKISTAFTIVPSSTPRLTLSTHVHWWTHCRRQW
mmetsp:Transcript_10840/g.33234  ORF Transcript_10840/g.33234 Transcript_10840/m.33234 type:complete len:246 (+) Transcript_10840:3018-3755(+)